MSRANTLKTVNCTSCGAGLDVLGGGRVKVHVCGFCGSALDAQENYQIIKNYGSLTRPDTPFQLGMSGQIEGIEFTVIGTLGYEERWFGKTWRWTDHQLFSPTHGYAYLTVERGHLTFTRRHRDATRPGWLGESLVARSENPPVVYSKADKYTYYDTSTSQLTFVEGEFNWRPEMGQRFKSINAMSRDAMLSFNQTATEREINRTIYLPHAQTCEGFGVQDAAEPQDMHPLLPYKEGPHSAFLRFASFVFFLTSLALTLMLLSQSAGRPIAERTFTATALPVELPITVTEPDRLARIELEADVSNSWTYLSLALTDPSGDPVFEAGRTIEFYSGRGSDGSWTEGSRKSKLTFLPEVAGAYLLELDVEEAGTWVRSGTAFKTVKIRVYEGIAAIFWMAILVFAFLLLTLYQFARPYLHSRRRWWGSDWTDED